MQAKEDGDKPGLEAMLQKVLQLYASRVLSKRSYAKKGVSEVHTMPLKFLLNTQLSNKLNYLLSSVVEIKMIYNLVMVGTE